RHLLVGGADELHGPLDRRSAPLHERGSRSPVEPWTLSMNRVLIIVENLPCPFDRRVWQEARTLTAAGYVVSIICPKGKGYERPYEELDGIAIFRHSLP